MHSGLRPILIVWTLLTSTLAFAEPANDAAVTGWIDGHLSEIVALYEHLHAHPELSLEEHETAARVAQEFRDAGLAVTTSFGATGVVGVLRNGSGPVVLLRGDMDGLPLTEETGAPYASQVVVERPDGTRTGVMHACGHDVHTANLVGTVRMLAALKDRWRGTLLAIAQPAEEIGQGARRMLAAGLFEKFPKPDVALALHVWSDMEAGHVGTTPGFWAANVDSVDITVYGRGGHGARPHAAVDPVVTAAHLVVALQTLVSRRVDPLEPAVVTVGSIHAGTKHNLIPNTAHLQLTVRSFSKPVREQLLSGIRQIAVDTCRTFQCPQPPDVELKDEYTPAAYNDPALTRSAGELFRTLFGEDHVIDSPPGMGGEDFGMYAPALGIPGLLFRLGTIDPNTVSQPVPSLHSSRFLPLAEKTLRTGLRAMGNLVLSQLDAASD